jgi:tRNA A58 N-methylase Trm61
MGMNREALRADLKSKLETALVVGVGVAAVYSYLPKTLGGQSPVITIETGPSTPSNTPDEPQQVGLILGLWIDRTDASAAEHQLNDFAEAVIDVIFDNYNAVWIRPTETDYAIDEGKPYRLEWHEISVEWW